MYDSTPGSNSALLCKETGLRNSSVALNTSGVAPNSLQISHAGGVISTSATGAALSAAARSAHVGDIDGSGFDDGIDIERGKEPGVDQNTTGATLTSTANRGVANDINSGQVDRDCEEKRGVQLPVTPSMRWSVLSCRIFPHINSI